MHDTDLIVLNDKHNWCSVSKLKYLVMIDHVQAILGFRLEVLLLINRLIPLSYLVWSNSLQWTSSKK